MTDLNELLERVKKATGPSMVLEAELYATIGGAPHTTVAGNRTVPLVLKGDPTAWPKYTVSVDVALALVDRRLPNTMKRVCDDENGTPRAELVTEGMVYAREHGATWPLAILAALLSALIAKESSNDQ